MKTRTLTIRGIAVQITERENCRRFILRSRPDCPYAMLSVPKRSREADIRRFLENQQEWLQAHVGAVKNPPTFAPGEVHRLMGADGTCLRSRMNEINEKKEDNDHDERSFE